MSEQVTQVNIDTHANVDEAFQGDSNVSSALDRVEGATEFPFKHAQPLDTSYKPERGVLSHEGYGTKKKHGKPLYWD